MNKQRDGGRVGRRGKKMRQSKEVMEQAERIHMSHDWTSPLLWNFLLSYLCSLFLMGYMTLSALTEKVEAFRQSWQIYSMETKTHLSSVISPIKTKTVSN